jgi:hypothetical protein
MLAFEPKGIKGHSHQKLASPKLEQSYIQNSTICSTNSTIEILYSGVGRAGQF